MQSKTRTSRLVALTTATVLSAGALLSAPAPAQAAPKSKTYKAGAVALGVLGAYLLSKGKNAAGAAALGAGYLAYKKGENVRRNDGYASNYPDYNDRDDRDNNWNTDTNDRDDWNGDWRSSNNRDDRYERDYRNSNYNNGNGRGRGRNNRDRNRDCDEDTLNDYNPTNDRNWRR